MDYLDESNEKIHWVRECFKDGVYYKRDELADKLDTDFPTSWYHTMLMSREITLDYHIEWDEQKSWFHMQFTKYARIELKPQPKRIVLFSQTPGQKDKGTEYENLPRFQAEYSGWLCESEEALAAMHDFAENGKKLIDYFTNMQEESIKEFLKLIQKLNQFKDKDIVRVG